MKLLPSMCLALISLSCAMYAHGQQAETMSEREIHELMVRVDKAGTLSRQRLADYEYVELEQGDVGLSIGEHSMQSVKIGYSVQGVPLTRSVLEDKAPKKPEDTKKDDSSVAKIVRDGLKKRKKSPIEDRSAATFEQGGTFSFVKRSVVAGRPVLWLKYQGDPKRHTSSTDAKVASHSSGVMSFDEEDGALRSADLRFDSDVTIALVVKLKQGTHVRMLQTRLAPGVWMQQSMTIDGHGRFFFNSFQGHIDIRDTGYREVPQRATDVYASLQYGQYPPETRATMADALAAYGKELNPVWKDVQNRTETAGLETGSATTVEIRGQSIPNDNDEPLTLPR